jgi:GxxExxY protein
VLSSAGLQAKMDNVSQDINKITERIIGCAYTVGRTLGSGFLEKVYENALNHELRKAGLAVRSQYPIQVLYDGVPVGDFVADVLVEEKVLLEVKSVSAMTDVHMAQCLNYLKGKGLKVCLLVNFGSPSVEVKRIVHQL